MTIEEKRQRGRPREIDKGYGRECEIRIEERRLKERGKDWNRATTEWQVDKKVERPVLEADVAGCYKLTLVRMAPKVY